MPPKRLSLILIVLLLLSTNASAATIYARANGDWDNTSTWSYTSRTGASCGCVPSWTDDVLIYTRDVSVTNANALALSVRIDNSLTGGDIDFIVENGYTLTVASNINIISNNNQDDITINVRDDNSGITILGNVTVNMDDGENVFFEMSNDSFIQINGSFNADLAGTSSSNLEFNMDNASGTDHFHVNGDFYIYKNGARDIVFNLSGSAEISSGGDFTIDWDNTESNSDMIYFTLSENATLDNEGSVNISMNETGNTGCDIVIEMTDNSSWEVGVNDGNLSESFLLSIQNGRAIEFYLDKDAIFDVYGNASILQNGVGNLLFHINTNIAGTNDVQMQIDGDLTITKSNGEIAEFLIYEDADLQIGGNLSYTSSYHLTSGKDLRLELLNNASLDITGSMLMQLNSQGNIGNDLELILDNTADILIGNGAQILVTTGTLFIFDMDRDATFTVTGDLTLRHGGVDDMFLRMNNGSDGSGNDAQLLVSGDFYLLKTNGQVLRIDLTRDSDILVNGSMSVSNTGFSSTGQDVEIELNLNAGIYVGGNLTYSLNATGNTSSDMILDLNNAAILEIGNGAGPYTAYFQMDFTTGATGDMSIANTSQVNIYGDLIINKNGGANCNFDTNDDANLHIYNDLVLNNSENADLLTFGLNNNAIVDIDGDIDITSALSSSRVQVDLNTNAYLYLAGDILRNSAGNQYGTFVCNGSSTLELDGDAPQIISEDYGDGTDYFYFMNVVLNNSSGSNPQFTQEGLVTIHVNLDFQDGILQNDNTDYIIIPDNATVSSASDSSHVSGYVEKQGNDAFTFPVGSGSYYRPIGITISSGASSSDELLATYFNSDPNAVHSDTLITNTLDHISSCEYWDLSLLNGSPNLIVTLSYKDYDTVAGCSGVEDPTDLRVSHWNGALWDDLGNGSTTGSLTTGNITASSATSSFSPFTLASSSSANPLPIELISFTAELTTNQEVVILWSTASEFNNAYFTIEKSFDGFNWMDLAQFTGQGTKLTTTNYRSVDTNPGSGTIYYRLRQVDFNGQNRVFEPVSVQVNSSKESALLIYPNPTNSSWKVFTNARDIKNIRLFTLSGKELTEQIRITELTEGKYEVRPENLPSGMYLLKILDQTELLQLTRD